MPKHDYQKGKMQFEKMCLHIIEILPHDLLDYELHSIVVCLAYNLELIIFLFFNKLQVFMNVRKIFITCPNTGLILILLYRYT